MSVSCFPVCQRCPSQLNVLSPHKKLKRTIPNSVPPQDNIQSPSEWRTAKDVAPVPEYFLIDLNVTSFSYMTESCPGFLTRAAEIAPERHILVCYVSVSVRFGQSSRSLNEDLFVSSCGGVGWGRGLITVVAVATAPFAAVRGHENSWRLPSRDRPSAERVRE